MSLFKILMAAVLSIYMIGTHAKPTFIEFGPGPYDFRATHDDAFWVRLEPGTYRPSSVGVFRALNSGHVGLSTDQDEPQRRNRKLAVFTMNDSTRFRHAVSAVTLSKITYPRVDVYTLAAGPGHGDLKRTLKVDPVPEPASATLILAGLGLFGLMSWRRRQR